MGYFGSSLDGVYLPHPPLNPPLEGEGKLSQRMPQCRRGKDEGPAKCGIRRNFRDSTRKNLFDENIDL
jgi:hypothetical protein